VAGCVSKPPTSGPGSSVQIKDGDYKGSGKVTKISSDPGSVEMDHGDIPGLMPAMRMEFFVSDKKLLDGISVGDDVDFTILYKGGTETITKLTKK
jgi:Cu/Ag efflux protein CusF